MELLCLHRVRFHGKGLPFPRIWDGQLQHVTQPIFQAGFVNPGFFAAAVRDATLLLETRLRDLCDAPADLIGVDLVTYAFKPDNHEGYLLNPSIVPGKAQGIQALYRGAVQQIRNPVGHRLVNLRGTEVFDILALVNYLLSTAGELAKERFIHPFLPRWGTYRNVLSTFRADINNDSQDEIVVAFNQGNVGAPGARGSVLVLSKDAKLALEGAIPYVDGYFTPRIAIGDVDGDYRNEVLISFCGQNNTWHGILIDCQDPNKLTCVDSIGGEPLTSFLYPFEIKVDGAIVFYGVDVQPKTARMQAGQLVCSTTT